MMPSSFATWDVLVEQNRLQMMQRLERATSLARVATPPAATLPPPLRRGGPVLYTPPAECVVHPWTHAALTLWPPSSHLHDDGRTLVDFEADVLPAMSAVLACRPAGVGVSAAATPSPTAQLQLQQQGPGGSPPARSEDGAPASYGSSRAASATPRQQGAPREEAAAAGRQLPGAQLHPHSPAAAQQADAAFVGAGGQSPGRGQEGALDVAFALGDAVGHVQTAPLPVPPAASRAGSGAHRRHPAEDTSPRTTTSRQRDPAPAQLAPRASTRSHSHLLHSQASLPQQPAASADGGGASQRRASGGVAVGSATRPSASALPPALSSKPTSSPRSVEPPQPPLPQPSRTPSIAAVGGHHQADRARLLACELAEASFSGLAPPAAPAGYLDGIAGTDDQEDDGLGRQFSAFALQRLSGDDADAGAGARPLPQQEQFSSFLLARPPWQRGNSDAYHTPTLVGSTLGGGHPQGAFAQSVAGSFVIAGGAGGGALLGSLAAGAELLEGTDGDVSDPLIAQASAQAAGPPQADAYGNGGLTPQLSHGPHGPQQSEAPSPLSVDAAAPGLTGPEHAAEDTGDHAPLQHAVSSHGSQDPEEARDTVDLSDDVPSPGHAAAPALAEGGALHHVADRPSPSHNPVRTSGIHFTVVRSVAAAPLPTREEVEEARLLEELSRLQEEARASPSRQQMAAQDASRAARALNRMASETSHALGGFSSASSYAPAPGSAGVTMIKTVASRRHRRTSNASNGSTSGWGTPPFTPSSLPKASSQRYATKVGRWQGLAERRGEGGGRHPGVGEGSERAMARATLRGSLKACANVLRAGVHAADIVGQHQAAGRHAFVQVVPRQRRPQAHAGPHRARPRKHAGHLGLTLRG